jgi:hypothetical protein
MNPDERWRIAMGHAIWRQFYSYSLIGLVADNLPYPGAFD